MIKYIQKIFRAAALLTLGALAATACDKTIKVTVTNHAGGVPDIPVNPA